MHGKSGDNWRYNIRVTFTHAGRGGLYIFHVKENILVQCPSVARHARWVYLCQVISRTKQFKVFLKAINLFLTFLFKLLLVSLSKKVERELI
jgi:hypothetical protein